MALTTEHDVNYAAEVVRVKTLVPLEGLDNLRAVPIGGYQALVSKDTPVGTLMVAFIAGAQVSYDVAHALNLHRHEHLNADESKSGYLEDNRRVRAIRLRGHASNALLVTAESLGVPEDTPEGTVFTHIDGREVVRKYVVRTRESRSQADKQTKRAFRRVDDKFLPQHIDTLNYWRNKHLIPDDAYVTVTQKVHGTSIRLANTIVKRKLSWWERLAQKLGVKVAETEFDHVFGSRKVIKDPNNPNQNHFYGTDLWTEVGQHYAHLIPQNVVVYAEVVGWVDEAKPIQPNYTYRVPRGEQRLLVYRVAVVTGDGGLYDLPWEGVKQFCQARGLEVTPELWSGYHSDFVPEFYLDAKYAPHYPGALPLDDDSPCDEGVCVRWDGGTVPVVLKAKSPIFLGHEEKLLEAEAEDIESIAAEDDSGQ